MTVMNLPLRLRYDADSIHHPFVMDAEPKFTMNGFTFHLVEELIQLGQQGVVLQCPDGLPLRVKVRLLLAIGDLPALL